MKSSLRFMGGVGTVTGSRHHLTIGDRHGGLSAHADQSEIMRWLGGFVRPPRQTWVVHGEPAAARAHATRIASDLGWPVSVAGDRQETDLAAPGS